MILFGLGTIPLMTSVVYLKNAITISIKNKIQKAIPYVAVFIGILFILRGLGLGIPYISPSNTSLYIQQQPNCHR
jgi:sulfite exporter TauE/SafE